MDIVPPIGAAALWPLDVWQLGKDLLEGTVLWSQMALGHQISRGCSRSVHYHFWV